MAGTIGRKGKPPVARGLALVLTLRVLAGRELTLRELALCELTLGELADC
jgi:hypothetical protein